MGRVQHETIMKQLKMAMPNRSFEQQVVFILSNQHRLVGQSSRTAA